MADQKRWFKLWHSATSDDDLTKLPPATRWAWAAFGAHTKVHGEKGRVVVSLSNGVLAASMGVTVEDLFSTLKSFPHMDVEESEKRHGRVTVTWHNWVKYQEDSTQAERARASRSKRRGEEKRSEEKRSTPPKAPKGAEGFDAFWKAYPRKVGKGAAKKAFVQARRKAGLEPLLVALDRDIKKQWSDRPPDKIPHPTTWLNQERWEDEPPTGNREGSIGKHSEDSWGKVIQNQSTEH